MPRIEKPVQSPQYKLALDIFNDFRNHYIKLATESKNDSIIHTRMCVVALSQLAAMLAIDVGMTPDQFLNVSRLNFDEAYKAAPKFG